MRWEFESPLVRNIYAKNRQNPLIRFKVTIDVGGPFLRHSVVYVSIAVQLVSDDMQMSSAMLVLDYIAPSRS